MFLKLFVHFLTYRIYGSHKILGCVSACTWLINTSLWSFEMNLLICALSNTSKLWSSSHICLCLFCSTFSTWVTKHVQYVFCAFLSYANHQKGFCLFWSIKLEDSYLLKCKFFGTHFFHHHASPSSDPISLMCILPDPLCSLNFPKASLTKGESMLTSCLLHLQWMVIFTYHVHILW